VEYFSVNCSISDNVKSTQHINAVDIKVRDFDI